MNFELSPEEFETVCRPVKGRYIFKVLHKPTGISCESEGDTMREAKKSAVKILFKMIHDLDYKNQQKDASIFDDIDSDTLKKFKEYHAANPKIYEQFKKMAKAMRARRERYSHITIFEVIRWNTDIIGSDKFKINNNYRSVYVRLLIYNHPEFTNFFEKRSRPVDYDAPEYNTI